MPDAVTVPVFAAIYRAAVAEADFSLHLCWGDGPGQDGSWLRSPSSTGAPASTRPTCRDRGEHGQRTGRAGVRGEGRHCWSSTTSSPGGDTADVARLHREADRVLRAQGNRAGRQRMRADGSLRPAKPPRGLILSTGEDTPRGQSVRGRMLVLDVPRARTDWACISECQAEADAGTYARALAGFVRFLAQERAAKLVAFRADVERFRAKAYRSGTHRRTPGIVADLAAAVRLFICYARSVEAMDESEAECLWQRCWAALGTAAAAQAGHQAENEPTAQFRTYLASAINSGEAHLAGVNGGAPRDARSRGWRLVTMGAGDFARSDLQAKGRRVGWVEADAVGERVYLDPAAAFAVAQDLARRTGDGIAVTAGVLRRRLKEGGLLAAVDEKRETVMIRKTIEGGQKTVLAVVPHFLDLSPVPEPDKPDNDPDGDRGGADLAFNGRVLGEPVSGGDPASAAGSDTETPPSDAGSVTVVGFVGSSPQEKDPGNGQAADASGVVSGWQEAGSEPDTRSDSQSGEATDGVAGTSRTVDESDPDFAVVASMVELSDVEFSEKGDELAWPPSKNRPSRTSIATWRRIGWQRRSATHPGEQSATGCQPLPGSTLAARLERRRKRFPSSPLRGILVLP